MSKPRKTDPPVFTRKTVFLQRIQDAVAKGYCHYISGQVSPQKALVLCRKFAELYDVQNDKNTRYRRKANGLGNARLLLYLRKDLSLYFVMLVTPGEHVAHHLEKLQDCRTVPLCFEEFELVLLTLKGRSRPTLTWRFTKATVLAWQSRLHQNTAHHDKVGLYQSWYSLYRVPGFAGVRRQVGELVAFWRREWQMLRGDAPCPICYPHEEMKFRTLPGIRRAEDGMYYPPSGFPSTRQLPTLFYVRKQKDNTMPLSKVLQT